MKVATHDGGCLSPVAWEECIRWFLGSWRVTGYRNPDYFYSPTHYVNYLHIIVVVMKEIK